MQGSPTLGRGDIAKTFGIVLGIAAFAFGKAAGAVPNERATGERANRDAPGDVLRVAFSDCEAEPLGKQAFLKVLSLELGRRQLRESSSEAAALSVVYRCDGSAHVRVASTSPEVDRELRVDDVAPRERARALALAVAELARGGEPPAAKPTDSPTTGEPEPPPSPAPPPPREEPPAKPEEAPKPAKAPRPVAPSTIRSPTTPADGASPVTRGSADHARLRALLAVDARRNLEVTSYCYGGKVGLDYAGFRFLLEGCGAVVSVSRGTITSGIGDVRVGRAQPIVVLGGVQLGVDLSVAGGANWAVGNSSVVNTHLRRVLMPYADARVGLFAASRARTAFTPLIEVYAGRAVGIVSNADGEAVSATGGWFSGVELGLWL